MEYPIPTPLLLFSLFIWSIQRCSSIENCNTQDYNRTCNTGNPCSNLLIQCNNDMLGNVVKLECQSGSSCTNIEIQSTKAVIVICNKFLACSGSGTFFFRMFCHVLLTRSFLTIFFYVQRNYNHPRVVIKLAMVS